MTSVSTVEHNSKPAEDNDVGLYSNHEGKNEDLNRFSFWLILTTEKSMQFTCRGDIFLSGTRSLTSRVDNLVPILLFDQVARSTIRSIVDMVVNNQVDDTLQVVVFVLCLIFC